jgi:2-aminoadipate transaminase
MTELPVTQIKIPAGFIDLGMGDPAFELLPLELIQVAADEHFSRQDRRFLQYGSEQGDGYFRRSLADFLAEANSKPISPDQLFVTAGASSALDLLCTLFTQVGDIIFVEEPTYFLALRIFEDHGLRVIPISMDADGISLDALDEKLAEFNPKFVYVIPTFQNPSGVTLTSARRNQLVERAQQHDFLIVADEVYHFLGYSETPPLAFANFTARIEQAISVNSFSKILAPGLRLGWITAHAAVIKKLIGSSLLDSGGGMNPFASALVRGLIDSGGLADNIASLRQVYALRRDSLDEALREFLPMAEYKFPAGGFFFWVQLPGIDAAELQRKAREFNVGIRSGVLFSTRNTQPDFMRLGFCFYDSSDLRAGVKRLRACLEKYFL